MGGWYQCLGCRVILHVTYSGVQQCPETILIIIALSYMSLLLRYYFLQAHPLPIRGVNPYYRPHSEL